MCTVSVIPTADGFRVACNRDERRVRTAATAPRIRSVAGRQSVWPCDPQGGGTWIGANDAGLVAALLNRRGSAALASATTSRGLLIPALLTLDDIDAAAERAAEELAGMRRFEPFTLVMIQHRMVSVVDHGVDSNTIATQPLSRPLLFTSSSLGDHLADGPRRQLFADLVESNVNPLAGQAAFHRHRWHDRPEISVQMERDDAVTVSRTVIDVSGKTAAVRYTPLSSHRVRAPRVVELTWA